MGTSTRIEIVRQTFYRDLISELHMSFAGKKATASNLEIARRFINAWFEKQGKVAEPINLRYEKDGRIMCFDGVEFNVTGE